MIIRAYGKHPVTYAPDVGEVIWARRTPADKWVRAVVLHGKRNRAGDLRIKVEWLEDDPDAGAPERDRPKAPIVAGTPGWLVIKQDPREPRLVQQISAGAR
jgi:hypothetical protein